MCLFCLVLRSDAGKVVDGASAEPAAGAFEDVHVGVVGDVVDHGRSYGLISGYAGLDIPGAWRVKRLAGTAVCSSYKGCGF